MGDASSHSLGAVLSLAVVEDLLELDRAAFLQTVSVLNAGEMAENIFAAVFRLDEAEPAIVPSTGGSLAFSTTIATAATTVTRRTATATAITRRAAITWWTAITWGASAPVCHVASRFDGRSDNRMS